MESELKDGEVVLRMPVNEAAALRIALSRLRSSDMLLSAWTGI